MRLISTARLAALSSISSSPHSSAESMLPFTAKVEAAAVPGSAVVSIVLKMTMPSLPPVNFRPASSSVPRSIPINASATVAPTLISVSTWSGWPSTSVSSPLKVACFSRQTVASTKTKSAMSSVTLPWSRSIFPWFAVKITATGGAPPTSIISLISWPVVFTRTARSPLRVTSSTPTSSAEPCAVSA